MEIYKQGEITILNDCYNANFDSMKAALETLARMEGKRKIAILGDMLELGEYSKLLHEKVGNEVVNNAIDMLITVGEEAKNIANSALENKMKNIHVFEKNEEAIEYILTIMTRGDVILVKASNGMKFIEIIQSVIDHIK